MMTRQHDLSGTDATRSGGRRRLGWLVAAGALALGAVHLLAYGYAASHLALPVDAVAATLVLLLLKHLGFLGVLRAVKKRGSRR